MNKTCTVNFQGRALQVPSGANLRRVLLAAGLTPHNGASNYVNCRGLGTCGTCAITIKGKVSPLNRRERWRLNFPPHRIERGLRLACQILVQSDLIIEKAPGFWGQNCSK